MKHATLLLALFVLSFGQAFAQPVADFDVEPDTICLGEAAAFTDLSTCNGCNVVSWSWNMGDGTHYNTQNPDHFYNSIGVHDVQLIVEDDNGMVDTVWQSVTVFQCSIEIDVDYTDPCCPTLWGPPGFVAYQWSNGATGQSIQVCADGIYELIVIDSWGNQLTDTVTINTISGPDIVLDSIVDINCSQNNSLGSIVTHVQGGTPPYTFSWNSSTSMSSSLDSIATSGVYYLTVVDGNGCQQVEFFNVTDNSNLYLATYSNPTNCGDNGAAWVTAQGLNPPYTYQWNDPNLQTTDTATGLAGGVYSVLVEDNIGCTATGSVYVSDQCVSVVHGRVFYDANQNCVFDGNDYAIPNQTVRSNTSNGYFYATTDSDGYYELHTTELDNEVLVPYNSIPVICPVTQVHNVQFNQSGDTITSIDFGLYTDSTDFDLVLHPGWTSASPGFPKKYWVCYFNSNWIGQMPVDATVRFEYDPALVYDSCTQGGIHDPQTNSVEWEINGLQPSSGWDWYSRPLIYFTVPASMEITDTLCSYFEILPISGDIDPTNNTLDICEPVTGSRDPNAKEVLPKGIGEEGFILPEDTVLFYTVHFQNNGNDTAFTVVVKDTLSEFLDPASVVPGAASHPYTFDISGQGVLTFRFDEILLPDSTTNEPESKGNFNFTVKLKPNLPLGTVIENTVGIYFDFNEPIITNTTVNTIHDPMSVAEPEDSDQLMLYPNPTDDMVTVISKAPLSHAWLTDLTGRRLMPLQSNGTQWQADLSALPAGIYLIEAFTEDGARAVKKVVRE